MHRQGGTLGGLATLVSMRTMGIGLRHTTRRYLPPCDEEGTETTHRRRLLVGNSPETNMLDKALFNMALRLERVQSSLVSSVNPILDFFF